ncbi:MAG: metal ABC transporter permease, partial [Candidatus Thermoplasmatota archaeon]|nr:metal ABC transporter permease [Candidatus Thermoplasmatota archaeon]
MGIGTILLDFFIPFSELFLPIIPGDVFPFFFGQEINGQPVRMFQRSLFATLMVTSMACFLGPFLMIRNLSLIGDGIAHVAFGGIGV